ncbi:MAG: glutamate-1-semialdehyde 2,1-aminomutase [Desulfovibrio alaskensis]|nr:glutamate-1-semialdehyde 2,1-aminomutase [Oleidesulfovibrio alaskensis]MBL3581503.1 glutamate-1-semialdehyde 2,1-aminomutase [Oleidesulfovibrio alaskensis]
MMERSRNLFERAQKLIPGGVNSPVRACLSVDSAPVFVERGQGSKLYSVDGREYIDFVESWGPLLLGHAHPAVNKAIHEAVDKGSSFGAPCEDEIRLAEAVVDAVPSIEMVRMVSSGTEATMSALRLARGYTGRNKLIKFEGCYHGHGDAFLASAGSGVATLSIPGTPGVPDTVVADTLLAPYNNLERVKALFENHGADIAAVIVEPMAGNMGLVRPAAGFLQGLRDLCDRYGALLIFDEVITGFRLSYGGAQQYFGITPDLTTLGKIIGGGMPVGAYGGRREIMERIAPCGDVYQAGTLAGNPVAMAAGIATLAELKKADYPALEKRVDALASEIEAILKAKGVPVTVNRLASMFTIFFTGEPVTDYDSAKKADGTLYTRFYQQMRDQGIYLAPSGFECAMVSLAHTEDDFAAMLAAVRNVTF